MELFKSTNIDFLGKKWYFLGFSLIFSIAGVLSIAFWHHIPLGVDFKGGTLVDVKFAGAPDYNKVRRAVDDSGYHDAEIQRLGAAAQNELIIRLPQRETSEQSLDRGRSEIIAAMEKYFGGEQGKLDLNNSGPSQIASYLLEKDPLQLGALAATRYNDIARQITDFRDKNRSGVLSSVDELSGVAPPQVINALKQGAFTSHFAVRSVQIVGPQVGAQLRKQAALATLYSLAGMLVYLAFRFEWIYGVAAVVAVFHDTLITVGAFSLTNKEITLTVIAAILTLIGYSMNDTIVIFDRIRENIKLYRRESLSEIVNRSINQTLSRTVLTSGLTFLTVLSLYLFGGEVLHGFSFALVIGILIGTYSSIAVAAPMLVAYQDWRLARTGTAAVPGVAGRRTKLRA
ncbi:MAG: protein translocase subunit SecF [Acidobacteria bacterium]|nr:MAG: protein translocase subunit SecF [Acidobacteriota bacterium]